MAQWAMSLFHTPWGFSWEDSKAGGGFVVEGSDYLKIHLLLCLAHGLEELEDMMV